MQLFEAKGYYFVFTIKLQSNEKTLSTSVQDLTNLYKQKDLKLNLSRVSGVKLCSKQLFGEGYRADLIYLTACFSDSLSSLLGCALEKSDLCILHRLHLAD
jgi:hypothetical protein